MVKNIEFNRKDEISMTSVYKNIGIASIVLGVLANVFMFTDLGQICGIFIPILLVAIIGLILSVLTMVLKYEKVWISIVGLLLNVLPLAYFVFLYVALG